MITKPTNLVSESLRRFEESFTLLNGNKLNKINAFEYRIIDDLNFLFEHPELAWPDHTNKWPTYSSAVLSAGKIYGFCVDNIHNETYTLLSGLKVNVPLEPSRQEKPSKFIQFSTHLDKPEKHTLKEFKDAQYEDNLYLKAVIHKVILQETSDGILGRIRVNQALDLEIGEECDRVNDEMCEEIRFDCSGFFDFTMEDIEQLRIFNEDSQVRMVEAESEINEMPSDSSEHAERTEEAEENSQDFNERIERIELFDDFRYIKPNEHTEQLIKQTQCKVKKPKDIMYTEISDREETEVIDYSENMISSVTLKKWKKEPPEFFIKEPLPKKIFFSLFTRIFTVFDCGDSHNDPLPDEEVVRTEREPENQASFTNNFSDIKALKRQIVETIEGYQQPSIMLNQLKDSAACETNCSLFFLSILHICNDFGYWIESIEGELHLMLRP